MFKPYPVGIILHSVAWDGFPIHKNNIWLWSETKDLNSAICQSSDSIVAIFYHSCFQSSLSLRERGKNVKQIMIMHRNVQLKVVWRIADTFKYFLLWKSFKIYFLHINELLCHNKYWMFTLTLLNLYST